MSTQPTQQLILGVIPMGSTMAALGTIGNLVRVTPWDDLQYWPSPEAAWEFSDDGTLLFFRMEVWLQDGNIFYGLTGPVVDGPQRYRGLFCTIIVREDGRRPVSDDPPCR